MERSGALAGAARNHALHLRLTGKGRRCAVSCIRRRRLAVLLVIRSSSDPARPTGLRLLRGRYTDRRGLCRRGSWFDRLLADSPEGLWLGWRIPDGLPGVRFHLSRCVSGHLRRDTVSCAEAKGRCPESIRRSSSNRPVRPITEGLKRSFLDPIIASRRRIVRGWIAFGYAGATTPFDK